MNKIFFQILLFGIALTSIQSGYSWSFLGLNFGSDSNNNQETKKEPIIIMLDPMGDARTTGREIGDTTERDSAFACAQELKKSLEANNKNIQVIITKNAGETRSNLQSASWANRIKAHLYITLSFFQSTDKLKRFYVYHSLYNPGTDFWDIKKQELTFMPYDHAYKINIKKTRTIADKIAQHCKAQERTTKIFSQGVFGLPCKPLMGVVAPALLLEMGLVKPHDWQALVPLLTGVLQEIIVQLEQETSHDTTTKSQADTLPLPVA